MNSADASSRRVLGRLPSGGLVELLRQLESRRETVRLRVETDVNDGEIDIVDGRIVDAYTGNLIGRWALFSLLEALGGTYELSYEPLQARPPLAPSLADLVAENARRTAEWRALSEAAPALTALLELSGAGHVALRGGALSPAEGTVLRAVDGRRTTAEVIDVSGLDAVEALRVLVDGRARGLLSPVLTQSSPVPIAREVPRAPMQEMAPAPAAPARNLHGGQSLRRRTVIGLGLSAPEPVRPKRLAAQRIVSVGPPAAPAPSQPPSLGPGQTLPVGTPSVAPVPHRPAEQAAGRKSVGRYEILCRIGHGGMGTVYLSRLHSEAGFRRLFALKVLRSHLHEDAGAAQKFLEEASLAGQIHHPNVVSVVDAGFESSRPYLVMDYVEGGSLKQLLSSHAEARPPALILPVIIDALAGLQAAHSLVGDDGALLRLVHCDISPENLLVGVDGVCRLTDFGIAKHGVTGKAREKATHGKPGYLAPEQIRGGRVDHRADIFGMGVVLYNALTGVKLFDAPTVEETFQQVLHRRIEPPSSVGLRPSPVFDFVCMRALEREPDRRYVSAEEMMLALRDIAMRERLIAPASEIAVWVRESVGHDLAQRRLVLLDATRRARIETVRQSNAPPPQPFEPVPVPRSSPYLNLGEQTQEIERTIALKTPSKPRRWALIIASILAATAVAAMMIWPDHVARVFRLNPEGPAWGEAASDGTMQTPRLGHDAGLPRAEPTVQTGISYPAPPANAAPDGGS